MDQLRDLFHRYGGLAWRRRWWGIAAAWTVCLAGWIGIALLPAQYEASARVFIDADAVLTPALRGIVTDSSISDQIDLLQRMLLSRPNLEKIIAKTDLQLDAATPATLQSTVETLSRSIKVVAQTRNIFSIAYRSTERQLSFDVVQAVLASFIENKAGNNRDDMERATAFIDGQIANYEKQLREAETARAEFRTRYVDLLPGDGGMNRLEQARQQVIALTGQLADAHSRRVLLAKELATTPPLVTTESIGGGGDRPLEAAQARLRDLQHIYTDAYPEVQSQKRLIETLRANPGSSSGGSAGGRSMPNPVFEQLKLRLVETDGLIESLQRQVDDATHDRERLDSIARGAPGLEAKYVNLNRDYDVVRKNYDELLARRESMRIASAAELRASNVKMVIIDPPLVPQASVAPPRMLLAAAVLVAGLGAAAAVVFLLIATDQSFYSTTDLRSLGFPVIGSVSLAALPISLGVRLRGIATFAAAFVLLAGLLGGVLFHFSRMA